MSEVINGYEQAAKKALDVLPCKTPLILCPVIDVVNVLAVIWHVIHFSAGVWPS